MFLSFIVKKLNNICYIPQTMLSLWKTFDKTFPYSVCFLPKIKLILPWIPRMDISIWMFNGLILICS